MPRKRKRKSKQKKRHLFDSAPPKDSLQISTLLDRAKKEPISGALKFITVGSAFFALVVSIFTLITNYPNYKLLIIAIIGGLFYLITFLIFSLIYFSETAITFGWRKPIINILIILLIVPIGIGGYAAYQKSELENKAVILVGDFKDPSSDNLEFTNELIRKLKAQFAGRDDIVVERLMRPISIDMIQEERSAIGQAQSGDLIIWGYYSLPGSTLHPALSSSSII